jgi:small subunit ribosomal protein S7
MRKKINYKREHQTDLKYGSVVVGRFINYLMEDGKKETARKIVYKALEIVAEKTGQEPIDVFEAAIKNVMPRMEVRPRRVGGASYQVPMEVRGDRKEALAIRWLLFAARARSNSEFHTMQEKVATEFIEAYNNQGIAIKKKEDVQRQADANRAFSHFRW